MTKTREVVERLRADGYSDSQIADIIQDKPLTVEQAAAFTGYSKAYLYKLIHGGRISCYKPGGGKVLFRREDLEAFCYRNRKAADYELQEQT